MRDSSFHYNVDIAVLVKIQLSLPLRLALAFGALNRGLKVDQQLANPVSIL